jgi:hypothetical protein
MLAASSGALWLMSTPRGKRGFFHEAWERGGPEWERIRAPRCKDCKSESREPPQPGCPAFTNTLQQAMRNRAIIPILTRISPSLSAREPPVSPQCFASARRATGPRTARDRQTPASRRESPGPANITRRQEVGGIAVEASKIAGHATVSMTGDYTVIQLKPAGGANTRHPGATGKRQEVQSCQAGTGPAGGVTGMGTSDV